jgi:hypothetical protein
MQIFEKLNKKFLLKPKLLYFTIALCFYMFHQFRGQFIFDRYGIEKGKLGLYLSVPQAFSFFSNIWIGGINDKSGRQKMLIVTLFIIGGICFESFFLTRSDVSFWITYTIYFSFMSATIPLIDKVMMDYVSDIPGMGPKTLGAQRMWLTFGYLVTNFSVEDIIATEDKDVMNYDKMRPFNLLVTGLSILFVFLFVKNLPRRQSSTNYLSSVKSLVKNFEYMYFIFIIVLSGISRAFMTTYLGIYYSKVLQFNDQKNTLGLPWPLDYWADQAYAHKQSTSTVFGVLLEIIVFYKSSFIIDKLGFFWPIFLSQIFQLLRFLCYYNLSWKNQNSFAYCCLFELLKGANYSLIHTSALQLANYFCPPDLRTTSQLIYNGSFVAIGTVLSGLIFKSFFSPDVSDVEQSYSEFNLAFKWNIVLTVAGMAFFVYKYGISENLLFNRENAKKKIEDFERRALRDEERAIQEEQNNENLNEELARNSEAKIEIK